MKLQLTFFNDDGSFDGGFELEVANQDEATVTLKDFIENGWSGEPYLAKLIDGETVYQEDQTDVAGGPFSETRIGPWVKQ